MPSPIVGGPPLLGCPRLLIQYIRIYCSYADVIFPDAPSHGYKCMEHKAQNRSFKLNVAKSTVLKIGR
jgi:hypothetical protein